MRACGGAIGVPGTLPKGATCSHPCRASPPAASDEGRCAGCSFGFCGRRQPHSAACRTDSESESQRPTRRLNRGGNGIESAARCTRGVRDAAGRLAWLGLAWLGLAWLGLPAFLRPRVPLLRLNLFVPTAALGVAFTSADDTPCGCSAVHRPLRLGSDQNLAE